MQDASGVGAPVSIFFCYYFFSAVGKKNSSWWMIESDLLAGFFIMVSDGSLAALGAPDCLYMGKRILVLT